MSNKQSDNTRYFPKATEINVNMMVVDDFVNDQTGSILNSTVNDFDYK